MNDTFRARAAKVRHKSHTPYLGAIATTETSKSTGVGFTPFNSSGMKHTVAIPNRKTRTKSAVYISSK